MMMGSGEIAKIFLMQSIMVSQKVPGMPKSRSIPK